MTTPRLSAALSMAVLTLALVPFRDDEPPAEPTPEPPRPPRGSLPGALMVLVPLPPAPRPGSGRERHVRRLNARRIAGDTGLDVELVYQALGRGESEGQIRERIRLYEGGRHVGEDTGLCRELSR